MASESDARSRSPRNWNRSLVARNRTPERRIGRQRVADSEFSPPTRNGHHGRRKQETRPESNSRKEAKPKLLGFAPYLRQHSCFSPGIESFEVRILLACAFSNLTTYHHFRVFWFFLWKVIVPFGVIEAWGRSFRIPLLYPLEQSFSPVEWLKLGANPFVYFWFVLWKENFFQVGRIEAAAKPSRKPNPTKASRSQRNPKTNLTKP